ncbi:phosphoribosyltransferase family protein [Actinotalea sp.]|uniref:phosphoribosyltransferase family protein n=1 Tax=Actinotalea sp. TaxID=1872145 RepID=UPI00356A8322
MIFADRVDAGRALAGRVGHLRGQDVVVLGLPRGGVPVAFEVAEALGAPLDVIVVRKLGVPYQPELAMGAIGEGGARVLDARVQAAMRVSDDELAEVERQERAALDARVALLRAGRGRIDLTDRVAVVVDDGIATGSTMRVACRVARQLGASRVVVAVPVAPPEIAAGLPGADEVVCVSSPRRSRSVGEHYRDFSATSDDEVVALLDEAASRHAADRGHATEPGLEDEVAIPVAGITLRGSLALPGAARGVVVFAHGSGSSRHSPRNRAVAEVLQRAGLGTLLLDLLSTDEEKDRAQVFDIDLLAGRLTGATRWLLERPDCASVRVGYFGASTGAGAALVAAADQGSRISAVVSRGGRPDLAGARLGEVEAPTLLVVGGADRTVLELNRRAGELMHCAYELVVVPGATHLFEEPGTLTEVALLARDWFVEHLLLEPDRRGTVPS